MDANAYAYAYAVKPPEKSLGVVIRAAEWLGPGAKPKLTTRCFNSVHQWVDGEENLRSAERPPPSAIPESSAPPPSNELPELIATPSTAMTDAEPTVLAAETVAADSSPQAAIERPLPEPEAKKKCLDTHPIAAASKCLETHRIAAEQGEECLDTHRITRDGKKCLDTHRITAVKKNV